MNLQPLLCLKKVCFSFALALHLASYTKLNIQLQLAMIIMIKLKMNEKKNIAKIRNQYIVNVKVRVRAGLLGPPGARYISHPQNRCLRQTRKR